MFRSRYFAARYWLAKYWAATGGPAPTGTDPSPVHAFDSTAAGTHYNTVLNN